MKIECVWEHNGDDTILYAGNFPGACTRGSSREAAVEKMAGEVESWLKWAGSSVPEALSPEIVQEQSSALEIRDADSDVLFDSERGPLTMEEYTRLKALALKSAADFLALYHSIPDPDVSCLSVRKTFYGPVPRTAAEMYAHTKSVNAYYFGEIGVEADNEGDILQCRERGFALLEQRVDFLRNPVWEGSYGEDWTLRKMLRRFIWHDRIHGRAMYRMAVRTFGPERIANPFCFER